MNQAHLPLCIVCLFVCVSSAFMTSDRSVAQSTASPFAVSWQLLGRPVENDNALYAAIKITNNRDEALGNSGWAFYFNRYPSYILPESIQGGVNLDRISGGFFRITPKEDFKPINKGETVTVRYGSNHPLIKFANGPSNGYFVFAGSEKIIESDILKLEPTVDVVTLTGNQHWIVTPKQRYHANQQIIDAGASACPITPTPMSIEKREDSFSLTNQTILRCPETLLPLASRLKRDLAELTGIEIQLNTKAATARRLLAGAIDLYLDSEADAESYELRINRQGIEMRGDAAGVFYATRSLLGFVASGEGSSQIPAYTIKDAPRFGYRGLHIDIARNFHTKANLQQILDKMSQYKLNRLHLHLCDDEGWRVEIEGLAELTEVGGRRGHTLDEVDRLYPAYGSGPDSEPNSAGSGFYTREDFIEILKYATQRHIEVIPELDFPGHARAAIVAMKRRFDRKMAAGDEAGANKFLLSDPDDQSEYWSIQYYNDNVVCGAQPGVIRFFAKVVDDLLVMYQAAGANLSIVHTGGDEVPKGVWQKSPMCQKYIAANDEVRDVGELSYDFLSKLADVLEQRNIQLAGWEEIALKSDPEHGQEEKLPNPDFTDRKFIPYIWNSGPGSGGEELGYKLANAGYPVVLCNADHLYLSLSSAIDTDEPGYFWAGVVNTKTVFGFTPMDVYKVGRRRYSGVPIDRAEFFANATKLTDVGRKNVLGIQGQIWSETLRNENLLKERLYPKLFALAERAWAPQPDWAAEEDLAKVDAGFDLDYARFSNRIDRNELPKLTKENIGYHLPEPGVIQSEGTIMANVEFPKSLKIRYTIDGSQPTTASPVYEAPLNAVPGTYRFAAFSPDERSSDGVTIEVAP